MVRDSGVGLRKVNSPNDDYVLWHDVSVRIIQLLFMFHEDVSSMRTKRKHSSPARWGCERLYRLRYSGWRRGCVVRASPYASYFGFSVSAKHS